MLLIDDHSYLLSTEIAAGIDLVREVEAILLNIPEVERFLTVLASSLDGLLFLTASTYMCVSPAWLCGPCVCLVQ